MGKARNWKEWAEDALTNIPSTAGLLEEVAVERLLNQVAYHAETNGLHDARVVCSNE